MSQNIFRSMRQVYTFCKPENPDIPGAIQRTHKRRINAGISMVHGTICLASRHVASQIPLSGSPAKDTIERRMLAHFSGGNNSRNNRPWLNRTWRLCSLPLNRVSVNRSAATGTGLARKTDAGMLQPGWCDTRDRARQVQGAASTAAAWGGQPIWRLVGSLKDRVLCMLRLSLQNLGVFVLRDRTAGQLEEYGWQRFSELADSGAGAGTAERARLHDNERTPRPGHPRRVAGLRPAPVRSRPAHVRASPAARRPLVHRGLQRQALAASEQSPRQPG